MARRTKLTERIGKRSHAEGGVMIDSENAVQTLIERMGTIMAAVFLRETMSQPTDYLALKEKLFGKTSASDVYAAIKAK
jgi:hypothetical protein